jgi:hypothetical protein
MLVLRVCTEALRISHSAIVLARMCEVVHDPATDTCAVMVRQHAGSQGRTPVSTPEQVPGNTAGGWLRRVRADLRNGTHSGSGLLGTRAQEVLRSADGAQVSRRGRSTATHRGALCGGKRHQGTIARKASRDPQRTESAIAGITETMAGGDVG